MDRMLKGKIKSALSGFLDSFTSRNNDYNGYWALGIYYKIISGYGSKKILFNILENTTDPDIKISPAILQKYHASILKMIGVPLLPSMVKSITLSIEFDQTEVPHIHNRNNSYGEPYTCKITSIYNNKEYTLISGGRCAQHNPLIEQISARHISAFTLQLREPLVRENCGP